MWESASVHIKKSAKLFEMPPKKAKKSKYISVFKRIYFNFKDIVT